MWLNIGKSGRISLPRTFGELAFSVSANFSYNVQQYAVIASDDLAFCYTFNHVKGVLASGDEIDMRWRSTTCFSKSVDQWMITHEHSSVPFDPETGKASRTV